MKNVMANFGWAALFMVVSAVIGMLLVLAAATIIPKLLKWLTPAIDEEKEIARVLPASVYELFGGIWYGWLS